MEKSTIHITEFRNNQDIDYSGITSFKVQNNGESVVDINTIPVYPGSTLKLVEEDGTFCDLNLKALFTEAGKMPKFKAIYKQLDSEASTTDNTPVSEYKATLYSYEPADIVEFSQNLAGHVILTRSFDGGVTFDPANDIDLGFVDANTIVKYDRGGSMNTNAIQFRNNDLQVNSEIFMVGIMPFNVVTDVQDHAPPSNFVPNKTGNIILLSLPPDNIDRPVSSDAVWVENNLGFREAGQIYPLDNSLIQSYWHFYKFRLLETGEETQVESWGDPR